ncbi:hypothetical protein ACQKK5_01735, partial [Brevibacillus panacihumi]|uniref:hypothetical protein n=1 Tax=Brevibacillus panacihumi TaxID=497735 RepID=UPI003D038DC4
LICSLPYGILCHRASTLGSLHQLPVSYEATWLLPRLDFHQLAINGLLGALAAKGVFRLFRSGLVEIPNAFAFSPFFLCQLSLLLQLI